MSLRTFPSLHLVVAVALFSAAITACAAAGTSDDSSSSSPVKPGPSSDGDASSGNGDQAPPTDGGQKATDAGSTKDASPPTPSVDAGTLPLGPGTTSAGLTLQVADRMVIDPGLFIRRNVALGNSSGPSDGTSYGSFSDSAGGRGMLTINSGTNYVPVGDYPCNLTTPGLNQSSLSVQFMPPKIETFDGTGCTIHVESADSGGKHIVGKITGTMRDYKTKADVPVLGAFDLTYTN